MTHSPKEGFKRVNFLFQAAKLVLLQDPRNYKLCRYYIKTMLTVAEKYQIRTHPEIKRTYCKSCSIILLSGKTCRVRAKSKSEPHTIVTCLLCGSIKRYMWRRDYQLWLDKPEAWLVDKGKGGAQASLEGGKAKQQKGKGESKKEKTESAKQMQEETKIADLPGVISKLQETVNQTEETMK